MRYIWKGVWKGGEVTVEADDPLELEEGIKGLAKIDGFQDRASFTAGSVPSETQQQTIEQRPKLEGNVQCSEAIRQALKSEWGRRPRTISDLRGLFEQNALYYSKGTLSGMLTYLTKKGDLRRVKVNGNSWGYILSKRE